MNRPNYTRGERLALGVLIAISVLAIGHGAHSATTSDYAIVDMRSYFYFEQTGTFGKVDEKEPLVDTSIGAGDDSIPSNATMLMVDLSGPSFVRGKIGGTLEVAASAGRRSLLKQRLSLGQFFSNKEKLTLPFLIFGAGCEPVEIKATLTIGKKVTTKLASLPFSCSE